MIRYLFFDFDGTISDAYSLAFKSLVKTLDEFEFEFNKQDALKQLGNKMHIILKNLGLNAGHLETIRRRFYKHFIRGAKEGDIKLCVSINPLKKLKKEGYKLIVVSNSETSFLRASIKRLKIKGLFNRVFGAEKFSTKDEFLKKLFKKYKIKPEEAVYIGDRFSDIEFARDAGCIAIAIHNKCSWSNKTTIMKEKPDFIIKDFRGLGKVLKKLNKE
ncbi:HAD family hydrolase [archaeon]|jgi:phosphoglycolate phosphatase-like HAD superfamily hydrolase|nr:HAD family hydrolase [archaeon]MBT3577955.1 HAD family hydrolase [archaeon]MBT6820558.1 HAD family hydrolase [archaeon]MBT6955927.1 HAD family hydrolase [archaeon]MBT7025809.1 HAD family hydrolase [archaeon]